MAQLVALMYGVVLGGVAEVVGSNLARGKIFTAYIGSVDSLYPSVYIYICSFANRQIYRNIRIHAHRHFLKHTCECMDRCIYRTFQTHVQIARFIEIYTYMHDNAQT